MLITPHFRSEEFTCNCECGVDKVERSLVEVLEILRTRLGNLPVRVTSGYRCPPHNEAIGGAKHSLHMKGRAADIVVPGVGMRRLYEVAASIPEIKGIGLASTFLHVDVREDVERALWGYSLSGAVVPFSIEALV